MTPEEALRLLRLIRYAPRPPTMTWLARQTGYTSAWLAAVERSGTMTQHMADRLQPTFDRLDFNGGQIAHRWPLGPLGAGPDAGPRGGARPRRKRRRRSMSLVVT
jgi:hypothetical protein